MPTISTRRNLLASFVVAAATASVLTASPATGQEILFWSNQAQPVEEAQKMRDQVLSGFGKPVNYLPQEPGPYMTRIQAEAQAGSGTISLIGGLHGDFASFSNDLVDLSGVDIGGVKVSENFMSLGKLGTAEQKYIPWMQAGYVMVANKQALEHLPAGADINNLTYAQLTEWGKKMREATGSPKLGFPAGPKGLMHRFFQGFLYPSYTNSVVTKFKSAEAEQMWNDFKAMWAEVNPASTGYGFMQEPLLTGDVWVAWDHVARLQQALNDKPGDFVAFQVPSGPLGRGFMPVLAGVGIPKTSPTMDDSKALVAYMLKPETQIATLKATAFFPVVEVTLPDDLSPGVKATGPVLGAQASSSGAIASLLPIGLGGAGGKFNKVFQDSFQRIILAGQPVREVLDQEALNMKAVIDETKAPCWAPDQPSEGPCPVE
jgi:multiple sugar transport system substrate-binding protein